MHKQIVKRKRIHPSLDERRFGNLTLAQEPEGPDADRMLQELSMMKGIG